MKIAYILPSLINQGPNIVVCNLVRELTKLGCQIDVFYFDELISLKFPCPTHQISMNKPIDFDKYDIIHSHCVRPDWYVFRWRKRIKRGKIVTTLHQDTFRSLRYKYNLFISWLYTMFWCRIQAKFDGIISISNQLKNEYDLRLNFNIVTIYNGCTIDLEVKVDDQIINKMRDFSSKGYRILGTYAYITPTKGLCQIMDALTHLSDYAFIVIGEGPEVENLESLTKYLGIEKRVAFFSYQYAPYNYLPYFDLYVMPSYSEGFGLAMVEAALAKKAIVCSDIPSFNEIFSRQEASFFTLDNTSSLINAIKNAYYERVKYGLAAYEKAKNNFTSETMAKNHLKYYQSLLK